MVHRLKNIEGHSIEGLKTRVDKKTHRFITYPYSISLIIGNINLFSPVYFLESENTKKHTLKYNLISFFLGWWSIPFGPSNTLKSIKTNTKTKSLIASQEIYLGQYTNTNEFSYTIGFEEISDESKDELMLNLRKNFYKHVNIEIIQINKENEFDQRLTELGKKIRH